MKLDRAELLKTIEIVKPALATRDLIPELLHIWFDGESAMAYNDADLGIQVAFKGELKGGLRGSILLGILDNSRAKEIDVEFPDKGFALIKAGRTKLKLALLPLEQAVFELPMVAKAKGFKASTAFIGALKAVILSIGANNMIPEQNGVTIIMEKGALQFYTTDSKTIAWATVKGVKDWPLKEDERVILPTAFVEQLIKRADDKTELFMSGAGGIMAITGDGVKLFARLVDTPKPLDFKSVIDQSMKSIQLFTLPSRLKLALERASIMLGGKEDESITIHTKNDILYLEADTPNGELRDSIRLEEIPKPVEIKLNPILLKRSLTFVDHIGINPEAAILSGPNFLYLIAGFS